MKKTFRCLSVIACLAGAVTVASFTTGCAGDSYSRSTGETIDDSSITAKVKSEMLADPDVKGLQVKVDTFRGQVQLTGFVDNVQQKQRAEQIARNVNGLQMVRNDIVVTTAEPAGAKRNFNNSSKSTGVEVKTDRTPTSAEIEVNKK